MIGNDTLYLKDYKMIMARGTTGFYEPIILNVEQDRSGNFSGQEIAKGSFYYDFLAFIKFSEKKIVTSGKDIGKVKEGFAEIYQYIYAFKALSIAERMNGEKLIGVFSRQ